MISIYEAVAPAVQQPVQQTPRAVVPQQTQPQQQSQPAQVPAQQTQSSDSGVNSAPAEPSWKKYLKYAAIAGGAIGGGALFHDIYHSGGISDWAHHRFGNIHTPSWGMFGGGESSNENGENDDSRTEATSGRSSVRPRVSQGSKTIAQPATMIGPKSTPTVDPVTYAHHMPQPANSRSWLDQMTGRRGYISNSGGYSYGGYGGEWADNSIPSYGSLGSSNYRGGSFFGPNVPSQPITDYDLGRRSHDFNGS